MSSSPTEPATLVDVTMPQMGVSVAEGTVVAWSVEVGAAVEADQTVCEITTDKIDTEIPAPVAGVLAEVLVAVGETVEVGAVLGRISAGGGSSGAGQAGLRAGPVAGSVSRRQAAETADPAPPARSASAGSAAQPLVADAAWGSAVSAGSARANASAADGTSPTSAGAPAGSARAAAPAADPISPTSAGAPGMDVVAGAGSLAMPAVPGEARRYSPVVQRIAASHGIDLAYVSGSGRGGRVTKKDVLTYVEHQATGTALVEERPLHSESPYRPDPEPAQADRAGGAGSDVFAGSAAKTPMPATGPARHTAGAQAEAQQTAEAQPLGGIPTQLSRMRQTIGGAMRNSLETAATCTTVVECDMSSIERTRKQLGLTALPLVARATIETLREFPDLNATLEGTTFTRFDRVHLGIAVSLGDGGLIVPVVHDAQELSPKGLGGRIKELARRARAKQLTADDVHGATFTITNPGAFGAVMATPVINVPQVAILDLEAIVKRPVVVTDADGNDAIAIRPMVNLCMSWDHRALDGAYAAQFLTALRRRLEGA